MAYKKLIPFINTESESTDSVIALAEKYVNAGADELFVFRYSANELEREDFLTLLKKLTQTIDIPVTAGIYLDRFEDAKKAFYTGISKIAVQNKMLKDYSAFNEASERFGKENVYLEMDEKEFIEDDYDAEYYIVKHLSLSAEFLDKISNEKCHIMLRDSLRKNTLETLFSLDNLIGVSTNSLSDANLSKIKNDLVAKGIEMNVFTSILSFSDFKTDANGLVPVIVQDYKTQEVLMLAYMNEEAFNATLDTGLMTYYSRSRQKLWCKGETSGHYQHVKKLMIDCDNDTILAKVRQTGAACHTGNLSCFYRELASRDYDDTNPHKIFDEVYNIIMDRKLNPREGSYTNYLFDKGIDKILKKCGEEATEMVIAAKNPDAEELKYEISDFLYHMMVLMVECGVTWDDITKELANR